MKKWIASLTAALGILLMTATTANAQTPFTDIADSFAKNDIATLYSHHIIGGYPDGTFRPDEPVKRAEFATMLIKAKDFPTTDTNSQFRDVQRGEWFAPYAELSYRLGVTSGTDTGEFEPNAILTREEMVRMAVTALGRESESARRMSYNAYSSALKGYLDRGSISSWAVKQVAYAIQNGMISGTYGYLNPNGPATRAQVAAFLNRSVVQKPKGEQRVTIASRGDLPFMSKKGAEATAYTHSGNLSAIGLKVREGLVAVDPGQIPLGSHLYIPGYGYGIAGDTGGAIRDLRIDLFHQSYNAAVQFGRRDVDVFILD